MSAKTNFFSKIWHYKKTRLIFFQSNAKKMFFFEKSWSNFEKNNQIWLIWFSRSIENELKFDFLIFKNQIWFRFWPKSNRV